MNAEAQRKLAEIQRDLGGKEITRENMAALEQRKQQQQQMREDILMRICTPDALDRLKRVGLVKGDVAAAVEDQLLSMAQSGQLQARVEESQVKDMLAKTSTTRAEKKVTITRRNVMSDEEDNDDDLL